MTGDPATYVVLLATSRPAAVSTTTGLRPLATGLRTNFPTTNSRIFPSPSRDHFRTLELFKPAREHGVSYHISAGP